MVSKVVGQTAGAAKSGTKDRDPVDVDSLSCQTALLKQSVPHGQDQRPNETPEATPQQSRHHQEQGEGRGRGDDHPLTPGRVQQVEGPFRGAVLDAAFEKGDEPAPVFVPDPPGREVGDPPSRVPQSPSEVHIFTHMHFGREPVQCPERPGPDQEIAGGEVKGVVAAAAGHGSFPQGEAGHDRLVPVQSTGFPHAVHQPPHGGQGRVNESSQELPEPAG